MGYVQFCCCLNRGVGDMRTIRADMLGASMYDVHTRGGPEGVRKKQTNGDKGEGG